ncbi:MAG: proteasome activator [Actinomycetota bacterium]
MAEQPTQPGDPGISQAPPGATPPVPAGERPLDPQKLLRLANLSREVLEEVRRMGPNNSTSKSLAELYGRVQQQLTESLPEPLAEELESMQLDLPFKEQATADEVRMVYSGLIGWLGGLFQGLHASMMAQPPPMLEPGIGGGPEPAGIPQEPIKKGEGYL